MIETRHLVACTKGFSDLSSIELSRNQERRTKEERSIDVCPGSTIRFRSKVGSHQQGPAIEVGSSSTDERVQKSKIAPSNKIGFLSQ